MIKKILSIISDIFIIPDNKKYKFSEIYLDKTNYYKKNLDKLFLDWIYIALEYEENLKNTLKKFKYQYNKQLHISFIPYLIKVFDKFLENKINKKDVIICWIPLFLLNFLIRGYNQTYILAENIAINKWLNFVKILWKNKYTKSQAKLIKQERLENLKDKFYLKKKYKEYIKWKTIIIIDDVISTWSTINEVARILKKLWAKKIYWIFLATWG